MSGDVRRLRDSVTPLKFGGNGAGDLLRELEQIIAVTFDVVAQDAHAVLKIAQGEIESKPIAGAF